MKQCWAHRVFFRFAYSKFKMHFSVQEYECVCVSIGSQSCLANNKNDTNNVSSNLFSVDKVKFHVFDDKSFLLGGLANGF
jgi:hypothetical protein